MENNDVEKQSPDDLPRTAESCRDTVALLAAHTRGVGAGAVTPARLPLCRGGRSPATASSVERLNFSSRGWPAEVLLTKGSVLRWTIPENIYTAQKCCGTSIMIHRTIQQGCGSGSGRINVIFWIHKNHGFDILYSSSSKCTVLLGALFADS